MSDKRGKFSPEFREAAVREVIEKSRPIADVARENGLVAQTLGNWVSAWRAEHVGDEPVLTLSERARLKELERQVRVLRMENEFLGKARPSSQRSLSDGEVRVHLRRRRQLPDRENVLVGEGVTLGVLRVARPRPLTQPAAPAPVVGSGGLVVPGLRRHLRLPHLLDHRCPGHGIAASRHPQRDHHFPQRPGMPRRIQLVVATPR